MGLFASQPENPFEWAGLPSEPLGPHNDAELLETPPVDPYAISTSGGSTSIAIDVVDAAPGDTAGQDGDVAATGDDD